MSSLFLSKVKVLVTFLFLVAGLGQSVISQTPTVTVRFANPLYECGSDQYCVDVEFLSDSIGVEVYGMNVRFFYPDNVLEFVSFSDFQGGYGAVTPNPPIVVSVAGASLGFVGQADFINGAIQITDIGAPDILLDTAEWTKLFSICFNIDDPDPDEAYFCPSIVFDLEQNPANGGYLSGDEGVVITIVDPIQNDSEPAIENVNQFNWMYIGTGGPPFGQPVETNCIPLAPPNADINASTTTLCYFTDKTFVPVEANIPGATYNWTFGYGAIPATANGYGPHTVYYDTAGIKNVELIISSASGGPECADSSNISFEVLSCPGSITGSVKSNDGLGIQGVNMKLYPDVDMDGVADTTAYVRSVFSTSSGSYTMTGLEPGNYVIIETQPPLWYNYDDRDTSSDGDIVLNIDTLDNLLPITLMPSEIDAHNLFMEVAIPGSVRGSVFVDANGNELPDAGEGLPSVEIRLHNDLNKDGRADGDPPVSVIYSTSTGLFEFLNIPVGHYVITEVQPGGFVSVKDYDLTNDQDSVLNSNTQNDTIPVSLHNSENDQNNYFIDRHECLLLVSNILDTGEGSLRFMIDCAMNGDTILFDQSLAGDTIVITSQDLEIDKTLTLISTLSPVLTILSEVNGLFEIGSNNEVEFRGLNIISGQSGNSGAAFNNFGTLKLHDTIVKRNPLLPAGQYLIGNTTTSELILSGNCQLMMN